MTKQMMAAMAAMLMVGTVSMQAQTTTPKPERSKAGSHSKRQTVKRSKKAESPLQRQIRELQEQQKGQQAQIDALTQAGAAKDAQIQQAQQAATAAATQAQAATAQNQSVSSSVQANTDAVQALKTNVSDISTTSAGLATTITANKAELSEKIESPAALHYKGITITPVAFFAFEGVYRQHAMNSDINTPFNAIPFPGANQYHATELNFTGRQSRLGGLFEGNAGNFKLSGYFEADFLSAGVTSNDNESNSYTLRQRQFWGKAETKSGFAVTGGQMWSLVTETGKSTDARTEKLPATIDSQYVVGYNWTRQPGIRFQQKLGHPFLGNAVTVAMSLENAQIQFAGANAPVNFLFGGLGNGGGLYNTLATYANNVAPDVIVKAAFDGKHSHLELGGMARFFRDLYYPLINDSTGATTAYSSNIQKDTKVGGGVFGSARVSPSKFVDVAIQGMAGDGTARYGSEQLGDVTAHPDGTLEPLRNYHGLFSLETHPSKKLDVFGYYGASYNQRTVYTSLTGTLVGYGARNLNDTGCRISVAPKPGLGGTGVTGSNSVANCASPTRDIQESVVGFTYRVVNSPKYGRLQYQATYSYLTKDTWSGLRSGTFGAPGATYGSGHAANNMVHVGMRYYIP
jgi:hypothetical protein